MVIAAAFGRTLTVTYATLQIKATGTDHGHEEKREISLRESQMPLRNRGKRVIGCRQRAESTQRVRPGYETDVLTEFPARLELRANRGANHLVDLFQ
jgi:hypothetical protein